MLHKMISNKTNSKQNSKLVSTYTDAIHITSSQK